MSQPYSKGTILEVTILDDLTATGNGPAIGVRGADRITVEFTRSNHSAGSSAFSIQGSIDGGTTWHTLDLVAHDGSRTRAQGDTLSANASALHDVDISTAALTHIRGAVTETTDGTHSAKAIIKF